MVTALEDKGMLTVYKLHFEYQRTYNKRRAVRHLEKAEL
jgi:hypothetical protein